MRRGRGKVVPFPSSAILRNLLKANHLVACRLQQVSMERLLEQAFKRESRRLLFVKILTSCVDDIEFHRVNAIRSDSP